MRCDASTSWGRCKGEVRFFVPNGLSGRLVGLCQGHYECFGIIKDYRLDTRLKLHHGGWLGPHNRYGYGSVVYTREKVDWNKEHQLKVPKYWTIAKTEGGE